ncbi:MAG: hypothetical protein ACNA8L_02590 [Luteolibacter sp.]|jgi:hypothetical protein
MGALGAQELILIFLILGVPAAAAACIVLAIVLSKRRQDRNKSGGH